MIEVINMSYTIPNTGNILTQVSFKVMPGEFIGVLGKNGAGKTTLIDIMMGFRSPSEGEVSVFGKDPVLSDRLVFKDIAFLSQDVWLKDNITVRAFFEFHSFFYNRYSKEDEKKLMEKFQLDYEAKIGSLSTGQKRRIQIIAAVSSRPKILFVDEITAVLDPDARAIFFKLLKDLNETHSTTILLATNIVEDLKGRISRLYFIKDTKLEQHPAEELDSLFNGEEL